MHPNPLLMAFYHSKREVTYTRSEYLQVQRHVSEVDTRLSPGHLLLDLALISCGEWQPWLLSEMAETGSFPTHFLFKGVVLPTLGLTVLLPHRDEMEWT